MKVDIRDFRESVHELGDVGRSAHGFQCSVISDLIDHGEQIGRGAMLDEFDDFAEEANVLRKEKIFGCQSLADIRQCFVVH